MTKVFSLDYSIHSNGMSLIECLADRVDCFARLLGPALVILAVTIIGFCTFVFFKIDLWFYHSFSLRLTLSVVGLFFLLNVLYNYFHAVATSPGVPPLAADSVEDQSSSYISGLSNRLRHYHDGSVSPSGSPEGRLKVCSKCDRLRQPRTHHCSVCRYVSYIISFGLFTSRHCILRYDHHCMSIFTSSVYSILNRSMDLQLRRSRKL
jgi:hypothetical protein